MFTHRSDDVKSVHAEDVVEPKLVISFSRASVTDRGCIFLFCDLYDLFCDDRAGEGRAHRIAFVECVRLDCREHMVFDKCVLQVKGEMFVCDEVSFVGRHFYFAFGLADICRDRDHTVVSVHVL